MIRATLVALAFWGLMGLGVAVYPRGAGLPQGLRPVTHPRCFSPGTIATEGFPMCPDSLPDQRAA